MFSVLFLLSMIVKPLDLVEEASVTQCNRVYLATYPRSGNTWIRQLVEEATHKITGSVYEGAAVDPEVLDPILIKTHFPAIKKSLYDKPVYKKAIRMIRHPIDSFYSFYLLKMKDRKKSPEHVLPREFLLEFIQSWKFFQEYWDKAENVFTLRYEDLLSSPFECLQRILQAIGYEVEEEDILRAITKYPPIEHPLKHLAHFTEEDLIIIQDSLSEFMQKYGYNFL